MHVGFVAALLAASAVRTPVCAVQGGPFSYADYAAALEAYVSEDGMVSYRELKAHRETLDAFVSALAGLDPKQYAEWPDPAKVAFWLNAYNGLTLRVVIDHYPIRTSFPASLIYPDNSIRQIRGVWTDIEFPLMGKMMTLDKIEHEVLRKQFTEPRIHMALVCAAIGCPPLRNEPYTGDRLDAQLNDQARAFLGNPAKFRIDRAKKRVYLSPIFDWFGGDFVKEYGTSTEFGGYSEAKRAVLSFISRYVGEEDRAYLAAGSYDIKWLDYDWSLNEQKAEGK